MNLGISQDESTAPFVLPTSLLQSLKNARVYKTGGVGKRPGWQAAATTNGDRVLSVGDDVFALNPHSPFSGSVGAAVALGTLNDSGQRVDYYGGNLGAYSLSEVEVLARETLQRDGMSGDGTGSITSTLPDFAVSSDDTIALIAWRAAVPAMPSGGSAQPVIMAMAVDVQTRAIVTRPTQISTGSGNNTQPIVVRNDSTSIVVVYSHQASNQIRAVSYNTSTRTFGSDTTVVSDFDSASHYDACEFVGSTGWYLIYRNTTPAVAFAKCSGVAVSASATIAENPDSGAVACYADSTSGNLWLAWYGSSHVRAAVRSATSLGTVVLVPTTLETNLDYPVQMGWAPGNGSYNVLVWTSNASQSLGATGYGRKLSKFRAVFTNGTLGNQVSCADVTLISKPYSAANGNIYAAFLYDASDVNSTLVAGIRSQLNQVAFTMMICDNENASSGYVSNSWRVAATWAIGEAGRQRVISSLSSFRDVVVNGNHEHWFMLSPDFDQILISNNTAEGRCGVDLCRQRITQQPPIFAARIGGNIVFSGGTPQVWDGAALNEYGFLYPPENSQVADAGAGGFLTVGTYSTQVVWEYRHATGDVARSAPSVSLSVPGRTSVAVGAANDTLTVTLPSLGNTRKWNDTSSTEGVIARVYRTEANGTLWYSEGDFTTTAGFAASQVSGVGGFVLSANVLQADAIAITHTELYTTGGILPNFPPPALAYVHTHRNRVFGIVAESRRQIVFTHEYEVGELPGWHPDLVIDVPDECVALATLDEKLVILAKNGIYLIAGNGPDRSGLNSDYDQPARLNSPHGCLTAASVVDFPNGVMYQAPTGFCLIDRQTNVTRVGGPVEDTVTSYPYAHSAVVLEDREWIYWAMTDAQYLEYSTGGVVIVYDWRHNVWSVDYVTFPGELGPATTYITALAKSGTSVYATIAVGDHVYAHTGFADPGPSWVYTYFKTAMLNLGSNSKYQRARWLTLLGEREGEHDAAMTVTTWTHTNSAPLQQFFVWPETTTVTLPDYSLKMHLENQTGAFMQVEWADGPPGGLAIYDNSARLETMMVEIGLKRGTPQMPQGAMQ
ncbi:MAG TPA: hypothetical protein VHC69_12750 [Polyangiaceae bacterium]|nr:hypothetical protein [Polyangiaceae bacterium]